MSHLAVWDFHALNVETSLSWFCHVSRQTEFRISHCTSILLQMHGICLFLFDQIWCHCTLNWNACNQHRYTSLSNPDMCPLASGFPRSHIWWPSICTPSSTLQRPENWQSIRRPVRELALLVTCHIQRHPQVCMHDGRRTGGVPGRRFRTGSVGHVSSPASSTGMYAWWPENWRSTRPPF